MKSLALRPPHVGRLTARVRALDGPLIQLWAWPGAGQQAVLDALTEDARFGQPLSLDDLASKTSLAHAVDAAFDSGARWLVLPAVSSMPAAVPAGLDAIARRLAPGQRLVFSTPRRRPRGPVACSFVMPAELLLTRDEVAELWRGVAGVEPGEALVERLLAATDGWYRPLRLVAEAAAEMAGSVDTESLVSLPSLASFLRHEVLGAFDADEREVLLLLSSAGGLGGELWGDLLNADQEALRQRLIEQWGLAVEAKGELRLPALLRWFLGRERAARWPPARRQELAHQLAAVELRLDRPVRALEHLAEAHRPQEQERLFVQHWPRLVASAPLGLLGQLLDARREETGRSRVAPRAPAVAATLLEALAEGLLWRRESAVDALATLAEDAEVPSLAATAGLAALLLGRGGPMIAAAPSWEEMPSLLRPLQVLAELAVSGTGGDAALNDDGGGDVAWDERVAASLLLPALEQVSPGEGRRGTPRGLSPLQALFRRGLLDVLRRYPSLAGELERREDLPSVWRRWLASMPPAALASGSSGYAVVLLGSPKVRRRQAGGRAVDLHFPLRRAFEVFAYLATAPGLSASRQELVAAVWADEDDATVEKNFHPTLSYLRRALTAGEGAEAPPLTHRRGVYRLNPRVVWNVDLVELERRAEEGHRRQREGQPEQAAELWRGAWGLYGGPLMAGWEGAWIASRREAAARLYLDVLNSLGRVEEGLGRHTEALDAYRASLIEDPLQEPVHLALMRVYARRGRRDLVRRQYDHLSALLGAELGVEPLQETTEAFHRLMS